MSTLGQRDALVRRFIEGCEGGEIRRSSARLTDAATSVADCGGAVNAARRPIRGTGRIARFLGHVLTMERDGRIFIVVSLNEQPAVAVLHRQQLVLLEPGRIDRIATIRWIRNLAKLGNVRQKIESVSASDVAQAPSG